MTGTLETSETDLGGTEPEDKKEAPVVPGSETDLGTEDEKPPVSEFHGAPEDGNYTFTLPDGYAADEKLTAEFVPLAKEIDLSPKGAQKLVDFKVKLDQRNREIWGEHLVELKKTATADPEIGGANYQSTVAAGRGVIAKYGTPEFRKMLNDYGVGAHPEMLKFMRNVAKVTSETPVLESGDGKGVTQKPLHEILYKD